MKRPWKVRWFNQAFLEFFMKSFHYEANAREFARNLRYYGGYNDVQLWVVEKDGRSTIKIEHIDDR